MDDNTPHRKYPRAPFLDYSFGNFFVTICTHEKKHYFGCIHQGEMHPSAIGCFLAENIQSVRTHYPNVEILNYVVMPNHVHLIVSVADGANESARTAGNLGRLNQLARMSGATGCDPILTTHHNSRLAVVVGGIKAATTRFARKNSLEFGWQSRFHDHLIRGPRDGDNIWDYINNNIATWEKDCFYI
ncbi:MAG: transposase [Prevotella sp.]|nr:transposase [Prevotella sp.]